MRLHGNEKTELIRKVPLFARCSKADIKEIAKLADEIDQSSDNLKARLSFIGERTAV